MKITRSTITTINLIFCALIVPAALINFRGSGQLIYFALAMTFGLFGASHILSLLHEERKYPIITLGLRCIAYFYILFVLYVGTQAPL